jgi:glycosyltransferase involved in cell wall biosynthesis
MKLAIVGSRGIPPKYGGFETFAEEISLLLIESGMEVTVQCDRGSFDHAEFRGIKLFYSSVIKTNNRLRYYFEGIRWGLKNADVILVLGSGGSLFYLLNLIKRKVILTNTDGLEYERAKWSLPVKLYWRLSEAFSVILSDFLIADSKSIRNYLLKKYRIPSEKVKVIEYGAFINNVLNLATLGNHSLDHQAYYLVVCRLEPENNIGCIIDGYISSGSVLPLIIVGNVLENRYVQGLYKKFNSDRIRFLGGIYDKAELRALRFSCKAYIHGHSVGGTNPSLLEAMGSSNIILGHDNVFNREVTGGSQLYFKNSDECASGIRMIEAMNDQEMETYRRFSLERVHDYYNWEMIRNKYISLLEAIADGKSKS